MKIALAHDSFTQMGGAERVIEALHELYPEAPVFTLVFDPQFKEKYKNWDIRASGLQVPYLTLGKLQYLLPLMPWGVDNLDFKGFDLVVSSSSGFVKNIRVPKGCIHINYCHTPTRFLWGDENYIRQEVPFLIRPIIKWLLSRMKQWDFKGAQRVGHFIANSKEVQNRIQAYYHRTSTVIYPFVDVDFWKPTQPKSDYFLLAGRLQAHKKNDLIIQAFNELKTPLHVAGTGRQENYLRSIAKPNIKFLGRIDDEQLRDEYSGALGFIYPQTEDFGLMPLEAAACGTATLAYAQGGALETVVSGKTGELFCKNAAARFTEPQEPDKSGGRTLKEEIKEMILGWNAAKYQAGDLGAQAAKFGKESFKKQILEFAKDHA